MGQSLPAMRQQDEYTLKLDFSNSTTTLPPADITGYTAWLTLKSEVDNTQWDLQHKSVAGDELGDDPVNGLMYLIVPSSETGKLAAGVYYVDLRIKGPGPVGEGVKTLIPQDTTEVCVIEVYPQIGTELV